jgi:ribonuclease R
MMIFYNEQAGILLAAHGTGILRRHSQPAVTKLLALLAIPGVPPHLIYEAAEYCLSTEGNTRHHGLGLDTYAYASSPLRRYADLVVHRALFYKTPAKASALKEIAEHISVTERNSADAERDSKDVKLFAFLKAQLESGEPIKYPALVTDVRNFGFFVDVPGLAMSGLVPLSTIEDDFYVFDDRRRNLVGRRTRRVIKLGDKLTVQVAKVDSFKKQVDFCLAVEERKPTPLRPQPARPNPVRPQQFSQPKKSAPFGKGNKHSSFTPTDKSHWKKSSGQDSRPGQARREDARQAEAKPMFRTSGSQLPTSQRPLLKSSGHSTFSKRRR